VVTLRRYIRPTASGCVQRRRVGLCNRECNSPSTAAEQLGTIASLEIDEHLAEAGVGMSDSTRHHDAVALGRLQKFALEHKLLDKPVFGMLEKPRVGQRDRVPTAPRHLTTAN
jgi:hypothetical protein